MGNIKVNYLNIALYFEMERIVIPSLPKISFQESSHSEMIQSHRPVYLEESSQMVSRISFLISIHHLQIFPVLNTTDKMVRPSTEQFLSRESGPLVKGTKLQNLDVYCQCYK